MKTINIFWVVCLIAMFSSCNDDFVEIDSLQVFGEEFYKGETVNLGIAVRMSNPDDAYYYWECDGGTLLQRQGYTLNQWKAPREAGTYTVRCTVSCGGAKQTREAKILVNGYFFERFGGSSVQGWSNSNTTAKVKDGRYELFVNSGKTNAEIRYNFNDLELYPPVSGEYDCGIIGNKLVNTYSPRFPVDSIAAKFGDTDNPCGVSITGNSPAASVTSTYYISEVRVEWYPMAHLRSSQNYYTWDDPDNEKTIKAEDFDAFFSFHWVLKANSETGSKQKDGWVKVPYTIPALKYGVDVNKHIGIAIAEDYSIKFLVDGTEIFTADEMKKWRASHDNAPFQIKEFKHRYPGKTAVYLDNVYFYDDGNFGK